LREPASDKQLDRVNNICNEVEPPKVSAEP
jgi:hypothetical protein